MEEAPLGQNGRMSFDRVLTDPGVFRICFVCTGNICRSPVGEYLIRQHAQEAGVPVTVTSSGTTLIGMVDMG